ncbi:MAG: glycosyltransferase family 39 protein, partial [Pseudomonadota bacterium]
MQNPQISIIVPTLNEAGNIGPLLDALDKLPVLKDRYEVVVADDASSDDTVAEAKARQIEQPVRVLERSGPRDLSASVLEAARLAQGQWIVVMDADGSHPVDAIADLLQPLLSGKADVSIGSRHLPDGGIDDWPGWRRWVSRTASLLAWPFTSISDPMSGLFATRRERLVQLPVKRAGYKILLEVLLRTTPEPSVAEVPFRFTDRTAGQSKMTAAVQWMFMRRLAAFGGAHSVKGKAWPLFVMLLLFVVLDAGLFAWFDATAITANSAQIASFASASFVLLMLFLGWFKPERVGLARPLARFTLAALLILVLRGGVFGLLLPIGSLAALLVASLFSSALFWLALLFYVFPQCSNSHPRLRWHLAALALIAVSLLLRALYLGQAELIFDEMYYWTYNLYPALSYLDHPPFTAWLIAIGTAIAGDSVFGVRLLHWLLAPLALWLAYSYGKAMGGKTVGLFCALLIATVPAWFASGFLMVTDAPQMLAWLAALYGFQRALIEQKTDGWVIAALAMGLGLLSKYTIAFLVPAVLLFIVINSKLHHWLWNWRTWLAAFVALLLFSPVLIWNAQNEWASFVFQTTRRVDEESSFSSHWLIAHTLIMLVPLAGIAALYVLGPIRKWLAPEPQKRQFMLIMTLIPLGFLAFFGAFTPTKFHWVMPIWLGVLPMIAMTIASIALPQEQAHKDRMKPSILKLLHRLWPVALPATLIVFGLGLQHVTLGLPGVPGKEYRLGYQGWAEIAEVVHELEVQLERQTGQRPIVAGMAKWGVSAALSFHDVDGRTDNITARNLVGLSGSQWEHWFDHTQSPDRPVILVHHEPKL